MLMYQDFSRVSANRAAISEGCLFVWLNWRD